MFLKLSAYIYSLVINCYHTAIMLLSPFNEKAYSFTQGRLNQDVKIYKIKTVWFHCASLGEFEQAKPIINWFYNNSKLPVVITFFSPSGYIYKSNYALADNVYYLPKDSKKNAKEFIEKINPALVFFIKYDFWYFFLKKLQVNKIPTYLVAGIFRENQLFFSSFGVLHKKMLKSFTHLFVQDINSLNLLKQHKYSHTSLANDTRFDTVKSISELNFENDIIEMFINNKPCLIAGSTWAKDEQILAELYKNERNLKLIIAPHNINSQRIKHVQKTFNKAVLLSNPIEVKNAEVLIIDSIGKLSLLYRYASICYIGGAFGISVHNVLEAAVYGKPLLFGPNHKKSKEAIDLLKIGSAKTFSNSDDLIQAYSYFKKDDNCSKASKKAYNYVAQHTGGTKKIIEKLKKDKVI